MAGKFRLDSLDRPEWPIAWGNVGANENGRGGLTGGRIRNFVLELLHLLSLSFFLLLQEVFHVFFEVVN